MARVVERAAGQLQEYQNKLRRLARLYVRGYEINTFGAADQDTVSKPTAIPDVWQVTKHLYKFKKKDFWPNFGILIADSGRALVFDCGLIGRDLLERSLAAMQEQLGLNEDRRRPDHAHARRPFPRCAVPAGEMGAPGLDAQGRRGGRASIPSGTTTPR